MSEEQATSPDLYQPFLTKEKPLSVLDKAILDLNKTFKTEVATVGAKQIYVDKIAFSSPRLNYMTYGGVPIGKATEFFGPESGGKTTAAIDVVGQAQKKAQADWESRLVALQESLFELEKKDNKSDKKTIEKLKAEIEKLFIDGPKRCVYIDAENTLDVEWAEKNGLHIPSLILIRPQDHTAEQVLQIALDLIITGQIECMVIDSLPMLIPKSIYENDMEKKAYCGVAGPLTTFSQKASPLLSKYKVALIGINQIREDIDNPYNLYSTPGGKAWKHLCALRLLFRKGYFLDDDNKEVAQNKALEPKGNMSDVKIEKTKVCRPDRRVGFQTIKYDIGIDVLADTVDIAIKYNFIVQSGAWFNIIDPETGEILQDYDVERDKEVTLQFQGRAALLEYLRNNEATFNEIYEAVNAKVKEY